MRYRYEKATKNYIGLVCNLRVQPRNIEADISGTPTSTGNNSSSTGVTDSQHQSSDGEHTGTHPGITAPGSSTLLAARADRSFHLTRALLIRPTLDFRSDIHGDRFLEHSPKQVAALIASRK